MNDTSSMVKLEPIEIDNNPVVIIAAPLPHSSPMKRSRKATRPSKTIKLTIPSSFMDQLTTKTRNVQIDEPITDDDDEPADLSNLNFDIDKQQQQNDEEDEEEEEGETSYNVSLTNNHKRPRLSYDKRLEANARERERVHNLTAAFEALRQVIPMYGDQPKLSRLSILRIACSYVLVLGSLNEIDFSEGQNAYTFNECFHMLSSTILGELKRKKATTNHHNRSKAE